MHCVADDVPSGRFVLPMITRSPAPEALINESFGVQT
jgi:hypothetical protein